MKSIIRTLRGYSKNSFSEIFGDKEEKKKPFGVSNGLIKIWRDPYDIGFSITRPKMIQFEKGVTVLVGCNGCGKSTLLLNIEDVCEKDNIPFIYYDNLSNSKSDSFGSLIFYGEMDEAAYMWSASEGEGIKFNLTRVTKEINRHIVESYADAPELWLLFDASDSGLSIDNIVELKEYFKFILEHIVDKDIYIVIASNEYELTEGCNCLDVMSGKYLTFSDYKEYKKYILKSRERKDSRIKRSVEKRN